MAKRGKREVSRDEFEQAATSFHRIGEALRSLHESMQKANIRSMTCKASTLLSQATDLHVQALRLKSQFEIEQATKPNETKKKPTK